MSLTQEQVSGLVKRAEEAIRNEFDFYNRPFDFEKRDELIEEAEQIGCTGDFIYQLKKDNI